MNHYIIDWEKSAEVLAEEIIQYYFDKVEEYKFDWDLGYRSNDTKEAINFWQGVKQGIDSLKFVDNKFSETHQKTIEVIELLTNKIK